MAGVSNQSKSRSKCYDIVFDGALLSRTRAVLVNELLHYFLYERQQIPLPIDQLRTRTTVWTSEESQSSRLGLVRSDQCHSQGNAKRNASHRKAKSLLGDLKRLSDNLEKAFQACTEVEQVAVLLGGTALNPKESLLIRFPPPCPDADCLPLEACRRTLFKQVISEDILGTFPTSISPSNLSVLLLVPRSLPMVWFQPKHSMKSPSTGTVVAINFHCTYLVPICHELTIVEGDHNISGLHALDCSLCDEQCSGASGNELFSSSLNEKGHSSGDNIYGGDVHIRRRDSRPASEKGSSQFCQHQKVNFEHNFKKVITSPTGRVPSPAVLKSCTASKSPCTNGVNSYECESKNFSRDGYSNLSLDSEFQIEVRGNGEGKDVDCIWYQSPLMLKGFKE